MDKKHILIVVHQMNVGGVQKALLSALDAINYRQNDVTLYIRKNRVDLLPAINKNVSKILINDDKTHYYRKPYIIILQIISIIMNFLGKDNKAIHEMLVKYMHKKQYEYEKEHYFSDNHVYDIAISYIQGYTAEFVADYIQAKRKIMFYHGSTDETHALHEKIMGIFSVIYSVSWESLKSLKRFYPDFANKMDCIENIVNTEFIHNSAIKTNILFDNEKLTFCSCGRLAKVKGFDLAVKSAEILKRKGIDFVWYFVGDGPERENIENLINDLDIKKYIVITGMQENPYPYIKNCDIYVQPSYEEAHPLSVIEAQILQRPVVSTRTAGGQSLVRDGINGILTDITAQSLAEGIIKLSTDKDVREKMRKNLKTIDYAAKDKEFKEKWALLLGD